jgi:2-phospho-L-lactate guanylyltransferase
MVAVLLPVKQFHDSKKRLAGFLSPPERTFLAQTMFEDVWETLRQAKSLDPDLKHLFVVTAEPYVIVRCREEGVPCLEEREARSHSDSVDRATRWAMSLGVTSLLSVPIDIPAVTPSEILELVRLRNEHAVVVAPSADGSGTNALLRTPPDAIAPHFGPGSFQLHLEEAQNKGLSCRIFQTDGLSHDLDTPEDLEKFLTLERPSRTRNLVSHFPKSSCGVPC